MVWLLVGQVAADQITLGRLACLEQTGMPGMMAPTWIGQFYFAASAVPEVLGERIFLGCKKEVVVRKCSGENYKCCGCI